MVRRTTDQIFLSTSPLRFFQVTPTPLLTAGHPGLGSPLRCCASPPTSGNYVNEVVYIAPWTSRVGNVPLNCWLQTLSLGPFLEKTFFTSRCAVLVAYLILSHCQVSTAGSTSFSNLPGSQARLLIFCQEPPLISHMAVMPRLPTNS